MGSGGVAAFRKGGSYSVLIYKCRQRHYTWRRTAEGAVDHLGRWGRVGSPSAVKKFAFEGGGWS